jgi:hypothetical protein
MGEKVRRLVQQQWAGLIALFLVLSGGTALATHETILSSDIVDGEVRNVDIRANAVTRDKVLDETLRASDIQPESIGPGRIADNTLTGGEILNDSLTGTDVDESSLGEVPSATLGGVGGQGGNSGQCDPESTSFTRCAATFVGLPGPSRVLIIGQIRAEPDTGGGNGGGSCRVGSEPGGAVDLSTAPVFVNGGQTDVIAISGVTSIIGPGDSIFDIQCNETAEGIRYFNGHVSFVALSPN